MLTAAAAFAPAAEPVAIDFNRDIRSILAENCFYCHGQDGNKREADLRLDDPAAAIGAGAIVPGDAGASTLLERIHSTDPDVVMPPPDSNRRLTAEQKQLLDRWVREGAAYQPHWAFVAPGRPEPPAVVGHEWIRNPVDTFVLAKIEAAGIAPSPEADRPTLIRRLHADFVGLPPTPAEVDAFVADPSPDAYERLVDRLLASPHYGERLALPWLDAARYADSNGFQQDGDTWQWLWRDWVVRSLNDDTPFDQFSIAQLAGDLLPAATLDQKIATGFNRNHLLNGEGGAIAEEQRFNNLFDRVDTTSTTWLGLTLACAQCHDHKYDPLTQADYYALLDAFNRVPESGVPTRFSARIRVAPPVVEVPDEQLRSRLAALEALIAAHGEESPDESKRLQGELDALRANELPRVMVMSDAKPRQTRILDRGDYLAPVGEPIGFAPPAALPPLPADFPRDRLGFARWLFLPEHPLTARVQVNRMWEYFFGTGLVKTSEDMGVQSEYPLHMELLDWLAVELRERGWSRKHLHRLLVTSATYRQASRVTAPHLAADPENRLHARAARFRMPALVLRDAALSAAGLVDLRVGGRPVYPYQPDAIWEALAITKERDFTYPASHGADLYRRSLYTFWRRTVSPANMFDTANRQTCTVSTSRTSTPLHALTTLNDPTWVEASRVLAEMSMAAAPDTPGRLAHAFRRVLGRHPTGYDLETLGRMHERQLTIYAADREAARQLVQVGSSPREESLGLAEHAALSSVCLALFNLDEALTRE
ncbi:MAG: PSD1 and planctomycete cytochrome C domain-containing protein [Pirellulales bacterium]